MKADKIHPDPSTDLGRAGCDCLDSSQTRRDFLSKTSSLVLAAFVGAGGSPEAAEAVPVSMISANMEGAECTYSLPLSDGVSIDSANQVILVRNANHVYAFALACPHENTALHWHSQDERFQCPRHQAKYQPDGTFMSGRATRNMDRFAIRLEGQNVKVDLNKLYRSDRQKTEWQSAFAIV
jgi:nitrite reductase/ring-hydroxylating ferredoxin subunit